MNRLRALALIVIVVVGTVLSLAPASAHSGNWYVSKWNGTYLRSCPAGTCKKLVLIPANGVVTANRHRGNWAGVTYNGTFGWVSLNVIRPVAPPPPASTGAATCFGNSWGQTVCAEQWVADEVWNAANTYGVSYSSLMALAACESNFDYGLVEWSGAIGLFQWMPSTWAWLGSGDIWSVHDQAYSTARAIANGYASHWVCWYRI